ncbi:hypothetical protein CpB0225 [Chlamydia pneumoniae TW-183]|uniref:Uncharacterized protein n=2 Tax=Chlamydia pneumoniae TaxID=83558 RepID=Q9Z8W3_CHLPN|nr:hypothetical protein [Chlamydia pneumoniae]AAD18374.1 hypothetical protein CPn_0221 [Chlamydia pneumoniae CWL029]AAF38366.1 hypothetical protein CP_0544 [Chlamydia pneumoniae AR39]AAP98158.1 hypothetical protein CpB0225 [Chlamydia pneumoniae TW-183]CRI32718.1 Uncharacterized protein BN1224_Wien1_A_02250 [Chlamydia pneumoniae]CRI35581.1 Uncharacterized protein BN1224_CM1_A_02280 [Chlamydia pneumoniae]
MVNRYKSSAEFSADHYYDDNLVRMGYKRNLRGLAPVENEVCLFEENNLLESVMASIPIMGSILGLGRLHSVWSTQDPKDSKISIIFHTALGILETLGLGIIVLLIKITITILLILFTPCLLCYFMYSAAYSDFHPI